MVNETLCNCLSAAEVFPAFFLDKRISGGKEQEGERIEQEQLTRVHSLKENYLDK